jgi:hypothetical protein
VPVPGGSVVGWSFGDGPPVYLLHGWGGSAAQLGAFVEPLAGAGFRVVAFDAPSHGASPPGPSGRRSSTIVEFAAALRAVAAVALRDGLAADRAVLVAPFVDVLPYTHGFPRRFGFGERVRARMVRRFERRFGVPMSYFEVTGMGRQMAPPPVLVVHDRDDRETAWSGGRDLSRAWPGARLLTTSGLGTAASSRTPRWSPRWCGSSPATAPSTWPPDASRARRWPAGSGYMRA